MRYDWHVDNKARRTLETRLREHGQAVTGQSKQRMSNTRHMSFSKLHWTYLKSMQSLHCMPGLMLCLSIPLGTVVLRRAGAPFEINGEA
jgi:hypothetical protein